MTTTHASFRFEDHLIDAIAEEAKQRGVPRTAVVVEALESHFQFGGVPADNGGGDRDHDQEGGVDGAATPPDLSEALGQLPEAPRRTRTTGGITTASSRAVPARRPAPQPDADPERRAWVRHRAKELHASGMSAPLASRQALVEWERRR